ncbi:MAG: HAD family hydrolase [Bacteroidales bacterium]
MNRQQIAILFDLDGVIFDTERFYSEFWVKIAKKFRPDVEQLEMKIKGHGLKNIYKMFFPQLSTQKLIKKEIDIMEKSMTFHYIAGVERFIRQIHTQNIRTCLVTSSQNEKMERVFAQRPEIKEYFPLIVTAEDITNSKPAPDCYLRAARLCNMPLNRCVVFEDSFAGIEAATKAEMKVIALATTYPEKELRTKADKIIQDFTKITLQEVIDYVQN